MGNTIYKVKAGQRPTQEQIDEVKRAKEMTPVFDEDCPVIDPEKTPKNYAAMMAAVAKRNQRISEKLA